MSWGSGTVGILLSRLALLDSFRDSAIESICRQDIEFAVNRIVRTSEDSLRIMGGGVYSGLSGLLLGLTSIKQNDKLGLYEKLPEFINKIATVICETEPVKSDDDLSLFTGVAGDLLARLEIETSQSTNNLLNPLSTLGSDTAISRPKPREIRWSPDTLPHLKQTPTVLGSVNTLESVNLENLSQLVTEIASKDHLSENRKNAILRDLELHQDASSLNFLELFVRESAKARKFQLNYSEGMDDRLLFSRLELDTSVSLNELPFKLQSDDLDTNKEASLLLRKKASIGVWEAPLSQLQYSLLSEFQKSNYALDAIKAVVQRVETGGVTQQQLAAFCLKMIRAFLQEGHLIASSGSIVGNAVSRSRLKKTRKLLLPLKS